MRGVGATEHHICRFRRGNGLGKGVSDMKSSSLRAYKSLARLRRMSKPLMDFDAMSITSVDVKTEI